MKNIKTQNPDKQQPQKEKERTAENEAGDKGNQNQQNASKDEQKAPSQMNKTNDAQRQGEKNDVEKDKKHSKKDKVVSLALVLSTFISWFFYPF